MDTSAPLSSEENDTEGSGEFAYAAKVSLGDVSGDLVRLMLEAMLSALK